MRLKSGKANPAATLIVRRFLDGATVTQLSLGVEMLLGIEHGIARRVVENFIRSALRGKR